MRVEDLPPSKPTDLRLITGQLSVRRELFPKIVLSVCHRLVLWLAEAHIYTDKMFRKTRISLANCLWVKIVATQP